MILMVGAAVAAGCTTGPASPPVGPASPPTGMAGTTAAPAAEVEAALLARPLIVPTIPAGATCPVTTYTDRPTADQDSLRNGPGDGPLYPAGMYLGPGGVKQIQGDRTPGPDGRYELKVVWAGQPGHPGPAVVRLRQLDGPGVGRVRQLYNSEASRGDAVVFTLTEAATSWPSLTLVPGPGCYGYQIDRADGTDLVVFRVVR